MCSDEQKLRAVLVLASFEADRFGVQEEHKSISLKKIYIRRAEGIEDVIKCWFFYFRGSILNES